LEAKIRSKIKSSTQDHLEVHDIIDDLVITKSRSVALVLQTNAVNFDLLSEHEQDNKIFAFAGLLNSLNFPIQILLRTKRIDITNYLQYLNSQLSKPMSEGLKHQLKVYSRFIEKLIVTNDVLDKKFYIIVPYYSNDLMSGAKIKKPKDKDSGIISENQKLQLLEKGKNYLYPKRDHILKQLGRMGLVGHQLDTEELIQTYYDIYNPEED
jgi:hypothetical protein